MVPPSGVVSASKKMVREGKSMTGVPVMPKGSMLPQGMLASGTGVPTFFVHTTAPLAPSSA